MARFRWHSAAAIPAHSPVSEPPMARSADGWARLRAAIPPSAAAWI